MFDKYTELARRVVFFARYEASVYGSDHISTEHLLLGVLRENRKLAGKLPLETARKEIEAKAGPPRKGVPTSVDLPLTREAQRALRDGADEAKALKDSYIGTAHLAMGLLRVDCVAAEVLRGSGLDRAVLCELRGAEPSAPEPPSSVPPPLAVKAPAISNSVHDLRSLVETS